MARLAERLLTPTSVISPMADMSHAKGFSLLELSVVLVLVSLTTAIVVPSLSASYNRIQFRSELEAIMIQLDTLSHNSYSLNESIDLDSGNDFERLLSVSDGWLVEVVKPVRVTSMGVCLGGEIRLSRGAFVQHVTLSPPFCKVQRGSVEE